MSSLRKLKRQAAAPKVKQAKKVAESFAQREQVAIAATLTKINELSRLACATINTCVCKVLVDIFKLSGNRISWLCSKLDIQADCLRLHYVDYPDLRWILRQECCWEYPYRKTWLHKKRIDMSAVELADFEILHQIEIAKVRMELMWLIVLHDKLGFGKMRLVRFLHKVRAIEKKFSPEMAAETNAWLKKRGIEFEGYSPEFFDKQIYFEGVPT